MTSPPTPAGLRDKWRTIDPAGRERLVAALTEHGYATDGSDTGLADHLDGRLTAFREDVIPWLDDARPLDGATVLEIGCGTGSSTVALAEQGARVIGIDIMPDRVEIAGLRCAAYGVDAELHLANVVDMPAEIASREVDLVVFFAALEHMTLDERLQAMTETWERIGPGQCWCVADTPNRLWVRDGHTAHLPFFHWLPDELAIRYAGRSPRPEVAELGPEVTADEVERLARHGRGVSYHEFELTMGDANVFDVVTSLTEYRNRRSRTRRALRQLSSARRAERVLRQAGPPLHDGFYEEGLNLVLRKR